MFSVTYLGHQGWLVHGGRSRILLDPLLTDEYSAGFSAEVHPPRRFELRRCPPIDAVVLSHEHADHLNLPSLALLDRAVPIVLPARSARVLRDAITGFGFRVTVSRAGDSFVVGDLEVVLLGGQAPGAQLEWEVTNLQILIADRARHGSFFSYVDGWPTAATLAELRRRVGAVGVVCHANNVMDWSCFELGPGRLPPPTVQQFAAELLGAEASWWRDGEPPAVSAICGPGLAFCGDDAWMNQILCVDSERVCEALRALAPGRVFRAPVPGETVELVRGRVQRIAPRAPFVRALDRALWPSLEVARRSADDFAPACGERSLDGAAWSDVLTGLERLAAFLYRRELFHAVLALDGLPRGSRRPAFALVLRCDRDDTAHVFEYQPEANRFARVIARRPLDTYALGLECWASDLWRVLVGRMLPQRLLGHLRTWSFSPTPLSPLFAIWGFFDALHRPEAAAAFYGELVGRLRERPAAVAAGRHARIQRRRPRTARRPPA